jgi:hypothetical protein
MGRRRSSLLAVLALVVAALVWPAVAVADAPLPRSFAVRATPCPFVVAAACADLENATVYVARGEPPFILYHELGHLYDFQDLTDGDREWFTRMLGLSGPWNQGSGPMAQESPMERFADAYATCALGWRPDRGQWAVAYGYEPTGKRHRSICRAIARAAV